MKVYLSFLKRQIYSLKALSGKIFEDFAIKSINLIEYFCRWIFQFSRDPFIIFDEIFQSYFEDLDFNEICVKTHQKADIRFPQFLNIRD